ncbi:hypothetical protein PF002_g32730 [Phytophthora fragariae]|uniref:Secreted protein n=1 Tax=Phytophthora fragariae TaxID=53985 RepID=A0A6A4AX84_9STRA|nr:hypothetical protein PF003_g10655 [Phytophthora fragariae]KAE8905463.1 hypothetical protein PF003_g10654 [Phytophthora fragariae]KAE8918409.1 hypothetical protein PF009_g31276 [Phytophthora fragariae]KAE9059955.1 hypothetical protein PF006_g31760 [Phytophthora fragariae]KAE9062599.1 hypothetical protein PF006_g31132 [Phytophthora fragariae]
MFLVIASTRFYSSDAMAFVVLLRCVPCCMAHAVSGPYLLNGSSDRSLRRQFMSARAAYRC